MKKDLKKLRLATETVRDLDLQPALGGGSLPASSFCGVSGCLTCRPPSLGCP